MGIGVRTKSLTAAKFMPTAHQVGRFVGKASTIFFLAAPFVPVIGLAVTGEMPSGAAKIFGLLNSEGRYRPQIDGYKFQVIKDPSQPEAAAKQVRLGTHDAG